MLITHILLYEAWFSFIIYRFAIIIITNSLHFDFYSHNHYHCAVIAISIIVTVILPLISSSLPLNLHTNYPHTPQPLHHTSYSHQYHYDKYYESHHHIHLYHFYHMYRCARKYDNRNKFHARK